MKLRKEKPTRTHIYYDPVTDLILLGQWSVKRSIFNLFKPEYTYNLEFQNANQEKIQCPVIPNGDLISEFVVIGTYSND